MEWLPLAGAAIVLGLGFLGMLAPKTAATLVSIKPDGNMGVTEIRVTYGAMFIGIGASALYFQVDAIFLMLGLTAAFAAAVRAIALPFDRSISAQQVGTVVGETLLALLFLAVLV